MTDDQYNKLSEMYAKKINECADKDAHIVSLESQLRDKDKESAELRSLKQSILESTLTGHFPIKDMSFHDKVVFAIYQCDKKINDWIEEAVKRDKKIVEKDKEIERLKEEHFKSLVFISDQGLKLGELREALRELYIAFTGPDVLKPNHELTDKCRKLIGE